MSSADNGIITRSKIIESCRHLFYTKGYHNTTYTDITNVTGINRGSVYYHFKEKRNIACMVQKDIYNERITLLRNVFPTLNDQILYLISDIVWLDCICQDPGFRRFFCESMGEIHTLYETDRYLLHHGSPQKMDRKYDDLTMDILIDVTAAACSSINRDPDRYSVTEIADYVLRTRSRILDNAEYLQPIIEIAKVHYASIKVATLEDFRIDITRIACI